MKVLEFDAASIESAWTAFEHTVGGLLPIRSDRQYRRAVGLLNALLSLWIAHFIGRGEMRFGLLLAVAVAGGIGAILSTSLAVGLVTIGARTGTGGGAATGAAGAAFDLRRKNIPYSKTRLCGAP